MIGIDPHKGSHPAAAVNQFEAVIDTIRVDADRHQQARLLVWAAPFSPRTWAVEGATGMGALLAQQLVAAGEHVVDVPPKLSSRVRLLERGRIDETDPNDARSAAIVAWHHPARTATVIKSTGPTITGIHGIGPLTAAIIIGRAGDPQVPDRWTRPADSMNVPIESVHSPSWRSCAPMGAMSQLNVLGEELQPCSLEPLTGYYRNGCCENRGDDPGMHVVCAVMTEEFLAFSKSAGNDLSTPMPQFGFDGLANGDQWCLCAARWQEAFEAGAAPKIRLASSHLSALEYSSLADLRAHAVDG